MLWLCNVPVSPICKELGIAPPVNGGWIDGAFDDVMSDKSVELIICYPQSRVVHIEESRGRRFLGIGFPWPSNTRGTDEIARTFVSILSANMPDVIHIFGTENSFCEAMAASASSLGMEDRVVVSIQGLVSECCRQFLPDFPRRWLKRATISELKNHCSLWDQKESYRRRGESEKRLIRSARHVIGRTVWDEGCCRLLNPNVAYHHVGESLRDEFYAATPGRNPNAHRIYFSQGGKPIKAMHRLIEALPMVVEQYPDVEVMVAGIQGLREGWARGLTYDRYLASRLDKLGLRDRFKFLGMLDASGVVSAMHECSVFVSTSSIENSPNSMGEAMILGLPCVATFVGGVPDIAEHGKEALLVPLNEAELLAYSIIRLFGDSKLSKQLSEAGRKRALFNHSKDLNRRDLLDTYSVITAGRDRV